MYLPKLGRTYAAAAGQGARRDGERIRPSNAQGLEGATILAPRNNFTPEYWPKGVPSVRRHFRPSLAYRLCLAAEGRFDAMLTLRDTWEWDVAAGTLIAAEAGAVVTTREGDAPVFNRELPRLPGVIVAGQALHEEILARLGRRA